MTAPDLSERSILGVLTRDRLVALGREFGVSIGARARKDDQIRSLVNSGELDGVRILSPRTVDLMDSNHLPDGVTRSPGEGYGLGVRVVTDQVAAENLTSTGTFGWSGAAGTHFFVDRKEDLVGLFMIQRRGSGGGGMSSRFETMVYQAIVE